MSIIRDTGFRSGQSFGQATIIRERCEPGERARGARRQTQSGRLRRGSRVGLERLEERTMLSTLEIDGGGVLTYLAFLGETNQISVSLDMGIYSIEDLGAVPTILLGANAAASCLQMSPNLVTCPSAAFIQMQFFLDDMPDSVTLQSLDHPTIINGGEGDDMFFMDGNGIVAGGTVDNIVSPVVINGDGGTNSLTLEDSSDLSSDQVTVTATQVGAGGGDNFFGMGGSLTYSTLASITINHGFANTVNVSGTANGTAVTINGEIGPDVYTVTGVGTSGISLDGRDGNDTYNVMYGALGSDVTTADTGTAPSAIDQIMLIGTIIGEVFTVTSTMVIQDAMRGVVYSGMENLTLACNSGDDGVVIRSGPTNTTIKGESGSDTFTVLFSDGFAAIPGNFSIEGGGQPVAGSDQLGLSQGLLVGSMDSVTYAFTNANDGNVTVDPDGPGGIAPKTISYTGLEPIADDLDARNRVFDFTGASETITIQDDGIVGNGFSTIDSTLGESVTFENPSASLTVNANAGTGPDTITLTALDSVFVATVTINASNSGDKISIVSFRPGTTVNGGNGSDQLVRDDAAGGPGTIWNITGANAGNLLIPIGDSLEFSNIENLTGSTNVDAFVFSNGMGVSGNINGRESSDSLDYSAYLAANRVTVNRQTSRATGVGGTFSNMESVTGGAGSDILVGANAVQTWNVTGSNAGNIGGAGIFDFSAMENLVGGSGADSFVFSNGAGVAGTINGQAGNDTTNFAAYATNVAATLSNGANLNATLNGAQEVPPVVTAATAAATMAIDLTTNVFTIDVFATDPTLANLTGAHIHVGAVGVDGGIIFDLGTAGWFVDGSGIHLVSSGLAFPAANVADLLAGNTYVNMHTMANAGGEIRGQLTVESRVFGTSTGTGGIRSIESLTGGAGTDSLTGINAAATWTIDGTNDYVSGNTTLAFSSVGNLFGGSGIDTFNVTANHTGNLNGAGGVDVFNLSGTVVISGIIDGGSSATLNYSGYATARIFTLTGFGPIDGFQGSEPSLTGGFLNITSLVGTSGPDSLTGIDTEATWTIDGTNEFQCTFALACPNLNTLAFSAIEGLNGGSSVDTFTISANHTGNLNGGGGVDVFNLSGSAVITGTLNGGSSATLSFAAYATARNATLTGLGSIDGFAGTDASISGGFDNITSLAGTAASDSLTGINADAAWGIDGSNQYTSTNTLDFSSMESLVGGAANDVFILANAATVAGSVNGQGGNDTLSYAAYTTAVFVNLVNGSGTGIMGGASGNLLGIETVIGGTANDTFTGAAGAENFSGGPGNDILGGGGGDDTFAGGLGNDSINGGTGSNWIDYSASATAVEINLQKRKVTGEGIDRLKAIDNTIGSALADFVVGNKLANILLGGAGNDSMSGLSGDDVLVGAAGADRLIDKDGRNLLIGGADADDLTGGKDEDILVAGFTDHDADVAALRAIMAEWSALGRLYNIRVLNLRNGTGSVDRQNGATFLSAATVHDDGASDNLTGGKKGLDWFLARTAAPVVDLLLDRDLVNEIADEI